MCHNIRCGFADVLNTLQGVDRVWAPQNTGSKDNGQCVGRHPVGIFLQSNPVKIDVKVHELYLFISWMFVNCECANLDVSKLLEGNFNL